MSRGPTEVLATVSGLEFTCRPLGKIPTSWGGGLLCSMPMDFESVRMEE